MGYPSGEIPMLDVHGQAVAGATFPVPIWHHYMAAAEWRRLPVRQFLDARARARVPAVPAHYYGYTAYIPTAPPTTTTTETTDDDQDADRNAGAVRAQAEQTPTTRRPRRARSPDDRAVGARRDRAVAQPDRAAARPTRRPAAAP